MNCFTFFLLNFCKTHVFLFVFNNTQTKEKKTHTGKYNTQQMRCFEQNWRIVDLETKILNAILYKIPFGLMLCKQ